MDKDLIIFTGQSGIKIEHCLKKLRKNGNIHSQKTFKIEDKMMELYQDAHPEQREEEKSKTILNLLSLPPLAQRKLWAKAFDSVNRNLEKNNDKEPYFMSFHASFYHQKNREFLSPIDLLKLQKLRTRAKMIILFVDDCYDIYRRLLSEGEMFHEDIMPSCVTAREAVVRSVWNLLTILFWREVETAFTRKISEILKIPMYTIAVKHPHKMIQRLLYQSPKRLNIYYIGHPISSIRRRSYARTAKFPEELNSFLEKCLEEKSNLVLFIPDTIDELRIKREGDLYRAELEEGWPLPFDENEWLFHPLGDDVREINPFNPKNFKTEGPREKKGISLIIEIFGKKVEEQITSRDYGLVEQSKDGMIIYKPYWEGDISGGALREARYNSDLRTKKCERRIFIVEEEENLGKYRIGELFSELLSVALAHEPDEKTKQKTMNLKKKWLDDSAVVKMFFQGKFEKGKIISEIGKILPSNYDFAEKYIQASRDTLHGAPWHEKEMRKQLGWNKIYEKVMDLDPFRVICSNPNKEYFIMDSGKIGKKWNAIIDSFC
jgi:hypothetical protein